MNKEHRLSPGYVRQMQLDAERRDAEQEAVSPALVLVVSWGAALGIVLLWWWF